MLMKASDGEWKLLTTVRTRPAAQNRSVGGAQSVVARALEYIYKRRIEATITP